MLKVSYFHMVEKRLDGSSNSFVRVVKLYTLNIWVCRQPIILGKLQIKKNYLWSMQYNGSLGNIDVILTICHIYTQLLHRSTSRSELQTCLICFTEHCCLNGYFYNGKRTNSGLQYSLQFKCRKSCQENDRFE